MATLMSLFSRRRFALPADDPSVSSSSDYSSIHSDDLAVFGGLGESQQSIEFALETVHQGLIGTQALAEQAAALRAEVAKSFEEHRKLALFNSAIRQDRNQIQQRLSETLEQCKATHTELTLLQSENENVRRNYDRARIDLEALEHRHHLLGVAKRETEDELVRHVGQLAIANEDVANLRLSISSLQEMTENYKLQISDLTAKFNESTNNSLLLSSQCDALETSLQQKLNEIASLNEQYDLICQEKDQFVVYSRQKEQELIDARAEASKIFHQSQIDKKARDTSINQLQADLDRARAKTKMLEDVNAEITAENSRLILELKRLGDLADQAGVKVARLEASVERLSAKLEATIEAKAQIEQSRTTMTARLEAMTQLLTEREDEAKRLADEVTRLNCQIERESGISKDTVESLEMRVFELEKELSAQRNETVFFSSQLQTAQRNGAQGMSR